MIAYNLTTVCSSGERHHAAYLVGDHGDNADSYGPGAHAHVTRRRRPSRGRVELRDCVPGVLPAVEDLPRGPGTQAAEAVRYTMWRLNIF